MNPTRLRGFLAYSGLTLDEFGARVGCGKSCLSLLANGHRMPGRSLAVAIERETAGSPYGAVRVADWDAPAPPVKKRVARGWVPT